MTELAAQILNIADAWVAMKCRETVKNGGSCIDTVQQRFYGTVRREAYCAAFGWLVVDDAARAVGVKNTLPKTAGAADLLARSRKVLHVDKTPAIGSLFYRLSTVKGSTGHIGVVVGWDSSTLWAVEGNHSDRIDRFPYGWAEIQDKRNGFQFIHTELIGDTSEVGAGGASSIILPALAIAAATGVFLYTQS